MALCIELACDGSPREEVLTSTHVALEGYSGTVVVSPIGLAIESFQIGLESCLRAQS